MINDYYNFLLNLIGESTCPLYEYLFNVDYIWTNLSDGNRAQDGIDLRCLWANLSKLDQNGYNLIFNDKPNCSMLELLIAFANRIENEYMAIPGQNRIPTWFRQMLYNLGLAGDIGNFNKDHVDHVLLFFIEHRISLFQIPGKDLSKYQLWDQMNYWLNYIN